MKIIFWDSVLTSKRKEDFLNINNKFSAVIKITTSLEDNDLINCTVIFEHDPELDYECINSINNQIKIIKYRGGINDQLSLCLISDKTLFKNLEKFIEHIKNKDEVTIQDIYVLYGFNPQFEAKLIINKFLHKCLRYESNTKVFSIIDERLKKISITSQEWNKWKSNNKNNKITEELIKELWSKLPSE